VAAIAAVKHAPYKNLALKKVEPPQVGEDWLGILRWDLQTFPNGES